VYIVKRYSAAQARQRLSHLLDAAERGESIVIERRGVRFSVRPERARATRARSRLRIEILDPAVADGTWTWTFDADGVRFRRKRR
jgi:antitoxin (DNA-binding transcriptional repressor) of toxin-antitoxin stability system